MTASPTTLITLDLSDGVAVAVELTTEPAIPDRAVLDEITEQIAEVFDAGNYNQGKALMEALVVRSRS